MMISIGAHSLPSLQTDPAQVAYTTATSAARRHKQGMSKKKKGTSGGGGRAWSEQEEAYLLQNRLQKMPYKHIAAHLQKTELACRLHYHQLSNGASRRKRSSSISSGSDHLAELRTPVLSCSFSPPRRAESHCSTPLGSDVQLPSIVDSGLPPRRPAFLPKLISMPTSLNGEPGFRHPAARYEGPARLPPFNNFHHCPRDQRTTPLPSMSTQAPTQAPTRVDLTRLNAIYDAHRGAFWGSIASEYGPNTSPAMLETAWRTGMCCGPQQPLGSPLTPAASPEAEPRSRGWTRGWSTAGQDKAKIASLLASDDDSRDGWRGRTH